MATNRRTVVCVVCVGGVVCELEGDVGEATLPGKPYDGGAAGGVREVFMDSLRVWVAGVGPQHGQALARFDRAGDAGDS